MAAAGDNVPMITARYRFAGHPGWQGFGHCGLLREGNDYFYVSQARLGSNKYLMDLHVRRMDWIPSGWPVVSPERYAALPQTALGAADLVGKWEHIDLTVTDSFNESIVIEFASNGAVSGVQSSTWSFKDGLLTLRFHDGTDVYDCRVSNEWDWERHRPTLVYTGLTEKGRSGWGKKID
jgi:arabinan endo-1,5-alpha-L-arabinosidase